MTNIQSEVRVGLFGYYSYGNFGDDLMAVLIAKHLAKNQVQSTVYGLPRQACESAGVTSAETLAELVARSTHIVYGGGGAFLTSEQRRPQTIAFEAHIVELCRLCEWFERPLHLVSVGGEGGSAETLSDARKYLLQPATTITFRNEEDRHLAKATAAETAVHDDLVWTTSDAFSVSPAPRGRQITVGIDGSLYEGRGAGYAMRLAKQFLRLTGSPVVFKVLWQNSRTRPRRLATVGRTVAYSTLSPFISEINTCDLLITNRLHLGMAGMSFGIPVIQYLAKPKARLLFKRLKLQQYLYPSHRSFPSLLLRLRGIVRELPFDMRDRIDMHPSIIDSSRTHLQLLLNKLRSQSTARIKM